jgi:hypothetical protein
MDEHNADAKNIHEIFVKSHDSNISSLQASIDRISVLLQEDRTLEMKQSIKGLASSIADLQSVIVKETDASTAVAANTSSMRSVGSLIAFTSDYLHMLRFWMASLVKSDKY